jgi:hypothetical protein
MKHPIGSSSISSIIFVYQGHPQPSNMQKFIYVVSYAHS